MKCGAYQALKKGDCYEPVCGLTTRREKEIRVIFNKQRQTEKARREEYLRKICINSSACGKAGKLYYPVPSNVSSQSYRQCKLFTKSLHYHPHHITGVLHLF